MVDRATNLFICLTIRYQYHIISIIETLPYVTPFRKVGVGFCSLSVKPVGSTSITGVVNVSC